MKKQRPIPPPGTAPEDPHLRLFLEKIHGYHTPPSVLELGQLAAALLPKLLLSINAIASGPRTTG
ncbi:MAG: hypothetical protein EOP87_19200 [Verrucomicrobiaceae bacterium]|nr:MAG: hypothetical protein EOP87_19200 [Verrucomicrobiaceae bacterium]